ncbi:hypothetical protein HYV44_01845 [Candidatus Microgenomates bacterium]|nr:hypothetical protein [Candidatus Microgenomates bacterium]
MIKRFLPIALLALIFSLWLIPAMALAADPATNVNSSLAECRDPFNLLKTISEKSSGNNPIANPSEAIGFVECALAGTINFLLELAIFVATAFAGIAGLKYMTSAGNPKNQESAIKSLQSAILGFALLFFVFGAINFILQVIEFEQFQAQFDNIQSLQ